MLGNYCEAMGLETQTLLSLFFLFFNKNKFILCVRVIYLPECLLTISG